MMARCYTLADVLALLQLPRTTFYTHLANGALPFVEELKPRIGRRARYRAAPIDRYLAGDWGRSRFFGSAKRSA